MRFSRPFLSTFSNRIDAKGRVSVPAKFREILEAQGARTVHVRAAVGEASIEAGGPEWMSLYYEMIDAHDPTSELHNDFAMAYLGDTIELSMDTEGRIVLPDMLIRHAGLEDAATFVGLGKKFKIWEPKAFDVRMMKARRSAAENAGNMRPKNGGGTTP